ncbi:MAG: CCA tRNA nucleotidyltransferase [Erysipelotrichaceae bacterium]
MNLIVKKALNLLNDQGYDAYLIGGCVRDSLLSRPFNDYDITTNASPSEVMKVFHNYQLVTTGIKHGTVLVIFDELPIEITTFRIDGDYNDNRHPDKVIYTKSLKEDCARRDFTINALAMDINGDIHDYYEGYKDLSNKVIRCVNEPNKRFKEDGLRILRALRFASTLNFDIEEQTKQAIFNNKELLLNISKERIQSELLKLLSGDNVYQVLKEYVDVLSIIIKDLNKMVNFDQQSSSHCFDLYEHTIRSVKAINNDPILRLTMLLHDIGKLDTKQIINNEAKYPNHSESSIKRARTILNDLKFSNKDKKEIITLIEYHSCFLKTNKIDIKQWLNKLGLDMYQKLLLVHYADTFTHHQSYHTYLKDFDDIQILLKEIIGNNECYSINQLAINGNDLIKLKINGSNIKKVLEIMLDLVINNKVDNDKYQLITYIQKNLMDLS